MGNHQLVFGAGNRYANEVAFPAGFNTGSITVGATNINDGITDFSANDPHIDVAAPGEDIWSTNFNDNYIDLDGTSMATPHVAGLASLVKGFNTNLANDDIEQIIRLSADDRGIVGFDNAFGAGRINAERTLQFLQAPNTLQQLSVTGGTINNTSGNMTRIFLGVPGLADAAYIVRRSEVRRNIAFPAMCNLIGVWGRGVGTTGLREENGISFGEGICEVVPGTLTATSATLRTWIYEVWTVLGQRIGFFPQEANNVIFQYTILGVPAPSQISGDNNFCTTSIAYSIPNLPAGSIVTWSATPSGAVGLSCNPCNPVVLTRNYDATVNLTATVTNACGDPIVINKNNVVVGFPPFIGPTGADTAWPNSNYYYYAHLPLGYPPVTNYYWEVPSGWTILSGQGTNALYVRTGTTGGAVEVDVTACDITRPAYKYVEIGSGSWWPDGGGGDVYMRQNTRLSPNPADNFVTISMGNNKSIKTGKEADTFFSSVTIYDITGAVKKRLRYKAGTRQARVNTRDLRPGAYIVEVSNGRLVERQQLIIQK